MGFNCKSITIIPKQGDPVTLKPESVHFDEDKTFTSYDVDRLINVVRRYSGYTFGSVAYHDPDPSRVYLIGRSLASWFEGIR